MCLPTGFVGGVAACVPGLGGRTFPCSCSVAHNRVWLLQGWVVTHADVQGSIAVVLVCFRKPVLMNLSGWHLVQVSRHCKPGTMGAWHMLMNAVWCCLLAQGLPNAAHQPESSLWQAVLSARATTALARVSLVARLYDAPATTGRC